MAIKPTDIIVYLDKERYLADTICWDGRPDKEYRYPVYWEKFVEHAYSIVGSSTKDNYRQYNVLRKKAIEKELSKLNIKLKESSEVGPYLKFQSEAEVTFFKLIWA